MTADLPVGGKFWVVNRCVLVFLLQAHFESLLRVQLESSVLHEAKEGDFDETSPPLYTPQPGQHLLRGVVRACEDMKAFEGKLYTSPPEGKAYSPLSIPGLLDEPEVVQQCQDVFQLVKALWGKEREREEEEEEDEEEDCKYC